MHVLVNGEEIVSTSEHPYYVIDKGWVGAAQLTIGDVLVLHSGDNVTVDDAHIELLDSPVAVYNFEVEDFHTYYVGDNSILVHNTCGSKQYSTERAAMRDAKRAVNIPMSQKPTEVNVVKMIGANGHTVFAIEEVYGKVFIRNDLGGHLFKDGAMLPKHFNAGIIGTNGERIQNGIHYFYK